MPQTQTPVNPYQQPVEAFPFATLPTHPWPRSSEMEHSEQGQRQEQDRQANSKRRNEQLKMILQQQMEEFKGKEDEVRYTLVLLW